jgi:TDG/mug DNA glycosylase family protein
VEPDTVSIYETRAAEWERRRAGSRGERHEQAARLAASVAPGALRVDLGCGPGFHLADLGEPVIALDAARSMLVLARERAPSACVVQADLEALPFRDRSIGGAWAMASYLHVRRAALPLALARLHWVLAPGAPAQLSLRHGDGEGPVGERSDFPGRFFAEWRPRHLKDVLVGAGFTVDEVMEDRGAAAEFVTARARRARSLPDTVGPEMRLLVCGLNPSLYAADRGVGFARPGNRFWPAAHAAGLVIRDRDPLDALVSHGIGMTDLVKRATRTAAELDAEEYRAGVERVGRLVRWLEPRAICFVGLAGWRAAVDAKAVAGEQPDGFAGVAAYVMPSTSGANAHARPADLAEHLRRALRLGAE